MSNKRQREKWLKEERKEGERDPATGRKKPAQTGRPAIEIRCFHCGKKLAEVTVFRPGGRGITIKCPNCGRKCPI